MKQALIILLIIGFLCCACSSVPLLVLGYWGFVPGLSSVMGATRAKDLGIRYQQSDLLSAQQIVSLSPTGDLVVPTPDSTGITTTTLTDAQTSALIASWNWDEKPFSNVQTKFSTGNIIEISGSIIPGQVAKILRSQTSQDQSMQTNFEIVASQLESFSSNIPFYIKGVVVWQPTQQSIHLITIEFGRFALPKSILTSMEEEINKELATLEKPSATDAGLLSITTGDHTITFIARE